MGGPCGARNRGQATAGATDMPRTPVVVSPACRLARHQVMPTVPRSRRLPAKAAAAGHDGGLPDRTRPSRAAGQVGGGPCRGGHSMPPVWTQAQNVSRVTFHWPSTTMARPGRSPKVIWSSPVMWTV
jgi:hypothetical protein